MSRTTSMNPFAQSKAVGKGGTGGASTAAEVTLAPIEGVNARNLQNAVSELYGDISAVNNFTHIISDAIADEYDPDSTYNVGNYVTYAGSLYKCNTAISTPEVWTEAHWSHTQIVENFGGGSANEWVTLLDTEEVTFNNTLTRDFDFSRLSAYKDVSIVVYLYNAGHTDDYILPTTIPVPALLTNKVLYLMGIYSSSANFAEINCRFTDSTFRFDIAKTGIASRVSMQIVIMAR